MGIGTLLACYFTLVRPPFHSLVAQWGVRGAVSALLIYMILIEPRWLRVTRQNVVIEGLPAALDGLRIAHVTDLHVGAPGLGRGNFQRVIRRVEEFQPDVIALTGDLIARNAWLRLRLSDCLPLHAKYGCFAVLGNADRRRAEEVVQELQALGVNVLTNRNELVNVNGTTLAIVGVNNPSEKLDDLETALRGVPADAGLTLLLAHAPDIVKRLGQHRAHARRTGQNSTNAPPHAQRRQSLPRRLVSSRQSANVRQSRHRASCVVSIFVSTRSSVVYSQDGVMGHGVME